MSVAVDLRSLWAVVRVAGDDTREFLHAQLTTDVKALARGEAQFSAYLSPKGRVLAHLVLVPRESDWLLLTHPSLVDALLARLRLFVLRSKVMLEAEEALTVSGRPAREAPLEPVAGNPLPVRGEAPLTLGWPGSRRLVILPASEAPAGAEPAAARWLAADIACGIPHVTAETTDTYVAQMLGLEALGALSYRKGCYPGQEIVARAHYLGRVKRALVRLATSAPEPSSGAALLREGRRVGEILIAAAETPGGPHHVLAVVAADAQEIELTDEADHRYRPLPGNSFANISHNSPTSA